MAYNISRGPEFKAKKVVIYGPEGIGKTSLASRFPNPLFIDTEGSTADYDVARFPAPTSWQMIMQEVQEVKRNPQICGTLVIDTADWAEHLCERHVCSSKQVQSIEDFGYGKGYVYLREEFGKLLNELTDVVNAGVNVVLTAHAQMRKFEQPDEMGAYDRWEMKMSKQVSPLVKEWANMILFANYKTYVIKENKDSKKGKAQGGQRVMYTCHHPCWDAKNRYDLPDILPLDYEAIKSIIEPLTTQGPVNAAPDQAPAESTTSKPSVAPVQEAAAEKKASRNFNPDEIDQAIPKNLRDLMIADNVHEWDLQNILSAWGILDSTMPVRDYTNVTEDGVSIIDGFLIPQWSDIKKAIDEAYKNQEIPFN